MNKPWLAYLSSVLLFFAGIFMIAGGKTLSGILFMLLSIAGLIIKYFLNKKN